MIPLKVRKSGDQVLSTPAKDIEKGSDIRDLLGALWETMYKNRGIGLAANQIGVLERAIVIHANGFKQEFINPVITKSYGGKTTSREGCLSFPGLTVAVVRSKQIIVQGFDKDWKPVKRKLKGLAAYCVQHEIDHLNGVTLADHA